RVRLAVDGIEVRGRGRKHRRAEHGIDGDAARERGRLSIGNGEDLAQQLDLGGCDRTAAARWLLQREAVDETEGGGGGCRHLDEVADLHALISRRTAALCI